MMSWVCAEQDFVHGETLEVREEFAQLVMHATAWVQNIRTERCCSSAVMILKTDLDNKHKQQGHYSVGKNGPTSTCNNLQLTI